MPSGGRRIGAGRKPGGGKKPQATVLAIDGGRFEPWVSAPEASTVSTALTTPPDGVTDPAAAFWREWSPLAVEQGTLVPATAVGFLELCEQMSVKRDIWARLQVLGVVSQEADRLLKRYEKIAQRVDASLARFRLTPFGKPLEPPKSKRATPSNPWARIVGTG